MSDLPAGWVWSTLGDVADVVGGIQKSPKRRPALNAFPMLRVANVGNGSLDLHEVHDIELFEGELERFRLAPGDVLIVEGNGSISQVGRAAIWNGSIADCVHQNHLIRARPKIVPAYLAYWLASPGGRTRIEELASSTSGLYVLSGSKVRRLPIPVAPLAEQSRIVAVIEEHLSRVDAGRNSLASAAVSEKRLRSALLADAVKGDWIKKKLGEVLLSLRNGCFVSRPAVEPPGSPILRISAVRPLRLDTSDVRYARDLRATARFEIEAGDLLLTRYSGNPSYVGSCAVVPSAGAGLLHPDKLIRAVPNTDLVLPEWVALALSASAGRREIEERLKTTAGQVGISGAQLRTVAIPVPPIEVQRSRVDEWTAHAEVLDRLIGPIEAARARSRSLTRTVLATAFSGRLVDQNAANESAWSLLDPAHAEGPRWRRGTKAQS